MSITRHSAYSIHEAYILGGEGGLNSKMNKFI